MEKCPMCGRNTIKKKYTYKTNTPNIMCQVLECVYKHCRYSFQRLIEVLAESEASARTGRSLTLH